MHGLQTNRHRQTYPAAKAGWGRQIFLRKNCLIDMPDIFLKIMDGSLASSTVQASAGSE